MHWRHILLTLFLLLPGIGISQSVDSLFSVVNSQAADSQRVKALNALSRMIMFRDPDSADALAARALVLTEETEDYVGRGDALLRLGIADAIRGRLPDALSHYFAALEAHSKAGNRRGMASALNNIANIYADHADHAEALRHYQAALLIQEELNDPVEMAKVYDNIGIVHMQQNDLRKAITYSEKALALREKANDREGIAQSLNNIGVQARRSGDLQKALKYQRRAQKINADIGIETGVASALSNISQVYDQLGLHEEALQVQDSAIAIKEEIGDSVSLAVSFTIRARILLALGKPGAAKEDVAKAAKVAEKFDLLHDMSEAWSILSEIEEQVGNTEAAFAAYRKYTVLKDSIRGEEMSKAVAQAEMRFQFEQKRKEDLRQAREQEKAEKARIASRNLRQYLWIFGVLAFAMLLTMLILRRSANNRLRRFVSTLTIILVLEFLLVLADPWIDQLTSGIPIPKLLANVLIAVVLTPLVSLAERKIQEGKRQGGTVNK